ncbi:PIN domain-like protein [Mycena belliarum]|uniref:PIN domain-like protein n=1 Tax=Mycena belliarum TaxID=1033014 RepID=A0AAD6U5Z5_9AGAR|nr:PIN domain-like protein [Mycena belliae]
MGVLGLTPFLQNPEVVKQLPDRLRGLAGKKIVIDGTLITQRLHFAQVPHPYRHVLGWYRLIKELEDSGVAAICVFDGKERSLAKAREAERRREAQRLAVARGSIELDRVKRLNRLIDVLDRFKKLDATQKGRISQLLQGISSEQVLPSSSVDDSVVIPEPVRDTVAQLELRFPLVPEQSIVVEVSQPPQDRFLQQPDELRGEIQLPPPTSPPPSQEETLEEPVLGSPTSIPIPPKPSLNELLHLPLPTPVPHPSTQPTSVSIPPISPSEAEVDVDDLPEEAPDIPPLNPSAANLPVSDPPPSASSLYSSATIEPLPSLDRPFPSPVRENIKVEEEPSAADITVATVATLYFDFRDSVRKLASLTPVASDVPQPATDVEQHEARVEYSMTKSQIQLTADEAKLWDELTSPASDPNASESPEETLSWLSHRADVMSQSYQRRTHPPTTQTYDESKELLRAMGIPCMDTTGTYEAEALASSLVINGFADYVASEDTDVVVYEAPLIRNITSRNSPLMMLSGLEIRTALQLDRSSFIDFALLLGTDFSQRIKNVGPSRALKFIRQHKSIERVIEAETKFAPRVSAPAYLAEVEIARMVFQTLPPVPDATSLEQVKDEEGLTDMLQRFGLGKLLMNDDWDFGEALQGNYFSDDPTA